MPLQGLLGLNGEHLTLEEAPEYFETVRVSDEREGVMPAEAVVAIIRAELAHEGRHARMSPSMLWPDSNCRREIYLRRFTPYYLDPLGVWEAQEGTLIHGALEMSGDEVPGYRRELRLPRPGDENATIDPDDGKPVVELWPGVFMSGTLDKIKDDGSVLTDVKTSKYPKTFGKQLPSRDFGEQKVGAEWAVQLNSYREMFKLLYGRDAEKLWVWRLYRGSQERSLTWRKFPIPIVSRNQMWNKIGPFVTSCLEHLRAGMDIEQGAGSDMERQARHLEYAKGVPMDGHDQGQFNGQKCPKYCGQRQVCFGLAGMMDF